MQAVLGGVPLMSSEFKSPNSQPHLEALNVMRHAPRMIAGILYSPIPMICRVDLSFLSVRRYRPVNQEWRSHH